MSMILTVCTRCERHVKTGEPACPFCGAEVAGGEGASPAPNVSRGALLALGAAGVLGTAVAVTSCGGVYGGPPPGWAGPSESPGTSADAGTPDGAASK